MPINENILITELEKKVAAVLSPKRWRHAQLVAQTAQVLAGQWGHDPTQAYLAGLMHDVAKELTPATVATLVRQLPPDVCLAEQQFPKVWHALVGPLVLKTMFQVHDTQILSAVKWHTTGRAKMSRLDKIIYIADYIEPERDLPAVVKIRALATSNLNIAVLAITSLTVVSLLERALPIHPRTLACHNYYLRQLSVTDVKILMKIISKE